MSMEKKKRKIDRHLCPGQKVCKEEDTGGTDRSRCSLSLVVLRLLCSRDHREKKSRRQLNQLPCSFTRGTLPGYHRACMGATDVPH